MAADADSDEDEYGRHFGRQDLDRVGFFDDAPPGPWDGYSNRPLGGGLREEATYGKQMSCSRVGGMFERQFKRLFIGEADKDDVPPPKPSQKEDEDENAEIRPIIKPPGYPKKHSTPGDWYGCLGKRPKHFSPETREVPPAERLPPNFSTSPSPFGGPGYADYCINPYVKMYNDYEPYDIEDIEPKVEVPSDGKRKKIFVTTFLPRPYFTEDVYSPLELPPSKKPPKSPMKKPPPIRFYLTFPRAPLGPNSGCFHSFPRHFPDPYEPTKKKGKKVKPKAPLHLIGDPGFKSKFTDSIVDRVTRVACNSVTYADYREQVYPLN